MEDARILGATDLARVRDGLAAFLAANVDVLGLTLDTPPTIEISTSDLETLASLAHRGAAEVIGWIERARLRPARSLLAPLDALVPRLAERAGKQVELHIEGGSVRVDAEVLGPIVRELGHVVRNAIDHGFEDPEGCGDKPASGNLVISFANEGDGYHIAVHDDGRGIDVARVAAKARAAGLCTDAELAARSRDELLRLHDRAGRCRIATASCVLRYAAAQSEDFVALAGVKRALCAGADPQETGPYLVRTERNLSKSMWNAEGRKVNAKTTEMLRRIVDEGGAGKPFPEDVRTPKVADQVLGEVVALNAAGKWKEARAKYDPAHAPFIQNHMEKTASQLWAVAVLGAESFLVRRGEWNGKKTKVLHLDGDTVKTLPGALGFALSQNRRVLAIASASGVIVSEGLGKKPIATLAWPGKKPLAAESFGVSDDGKTILIGGDGSGGLWLGRAAKKVRWTKVAPRPGMRDDPSEDDEDIDALHGALSPDGKLVSYGWQDGSGHWVDRIGDDLSLTRWGLVGTVSDTPYNTMFVPASDHVISNSRHMQSGVTVCASVKSIRGLEEYADVPKGALHTDEYLRAYGMTLLPVGAAKTKKPVLWIGGAGWSHAAPLAGGKPVFTHFFGSTLNGFDYDPVTKRAAVASASNMLHVLDPSAAAEEGREKGYLPRREIFRWIFWDTLEKPIRW